MKSEKYIFLLPGMLSPHEALYPLERYLKTARPEYHIAAVPLGLSMASFDRLVARAAKYVRENIRDTSPRRIVLFGHSHGGRVAHALARVLRAAYPQTHIDVITAGSPLVKRPDYLPWLKEMLFRVSAAYCAWPQISQVSGQRGVYSRSDRIVIPEYARAGYEGQLLELDNVSHGGLIAPQHIGSYLVKVLTDETGEV